MSAIPQLNIPVTVNTAQVAPAMRKVEKTIEDSSKRIAESAKRMAPAMGIFGGGPAGAAISSLAGMGRVGGVAAAGIGAVALPMMALSKMADEVAQTVRGAGAALQQFEETGKQNFAANSTVLKILADIEKNLAGEKRLGISGAMAVGAGEGAGIFGDAWNGIMGMAESSAAWWGSMFGSQEEISFAGLSRALEEADLKSELVGASEGRSKEIEAELLYIQRERGFGGNMSPEMLQFFRDQAKNRVSVQQIERGLR